MDRTNLCQHMREIGSKLARATHLRPQPVLRRDVLNGIFFFANAGKHVVHLVDLIILHMRASCHVAVCKLAAYTAY